jgi:heme/copper-type cytochrome/quinol oxidase subunit 4
MPDESVHSTKKVALGFVLGLFLSALCFVIAVNIGMNLRHQHNWVFPLLNAIALVLASLLALREYNESGIARGTVIALSLVFLVNAICGIAWMH